MKIFDMGLYKPQAEWVRKVNRFACSILRQGGVELSTLLFQLNASCYPSHLTYHNLGVARLECGGVLSAGQGRFFTFRVNLRRARRYLNKANAIMGNQLNTLCALADCAYKMKQYDQAYSFYQAASAIAPEDPYAQWKKCEMFFLLKRYAEACRELDVLQKKEIPQIYLAICRVTLGYCLLKEAGCTCLDQSILDQIIQSLFFDCPEEPDFDLWWELYLDAIPLFFVNGDFKRVLLCYIKIGRPEAIYFEEKKMVMLAYANGPDELKKEMDDLGFQYDAACSLISDQQLRAAINHFLPVNRWVENMMICDD